MLFKILQGNEANLPTKLTDGYCYYLRDKHYFYVDHKDPNSTLVRSKLSAEYADKLRYVNEAGLTVEIAPENLALKSEMLRKVELTQAEYDALPEKDPNVLYIITDAEDANYVSEDMVGVAGGVASLDSSGKVPSAQLPAMNYIPTSQKGAASGVASLGADGKVPTSQLPATMTPSAHNQAASTITAGTLAGQVVANATATATIGTAQVRNIYAGTADMTAGSSALPTGTLYFVYE